MQDICHIWAYVLMEARLSGGEFMVTFNLVQKNFGLHKPGISE